jgi:hypothetical protein
MMPTKKINGTKCSCRTSGFSDKYIGTRAQKPKKGSRPSRALRARWPRSRRAFCTFWALILGQVSTDGEEKIGLLVGYLQTVFKMSTMPPYPR